MDNNFDPLGLPRSKFENCVLVHPDDEEEVRALFSDTEEVVLVTNRFAVRGNIAGIGLGADEVRKMVPRLMQEHPRCSIGRNLCGGLSITFSRGDSNG